MAAAIMVLGVVVLGVVWTVHLTEKHSQEQKQKTYERCLDEAEMKHVIPLPSLEEIEACKREVGAK